MWRVPHDPLCRIAAFAIMVSAALFSPGSGFAYETASPELTEYVSDGGHFTCLIPSGWSRYDAPDISRELTKVYGVHVYQGGIGSRVEISVKYYAKDNTLQKTAAQFIEMHAKSVFGAVEEGENYGRVRDIDVKGVTAKTFERKRYEYEDHVYDPKREIYYTPLHPRKFEMIERYIVIPAREGFFVFRYEASPDRLKSHEPVFEKVVNSLTAKKELWPEPRSGSGKP